MSSVDNKRVAKNTAMLYVRTFVVMLITLYTSRVILKALGVEDYGIYQVVGGLVAMFAILSNALSSAISRFYINAIVYNGSTTSPFTIANSRRYADFGIRTHMSTGNIPPLSAAVHRFTVIGSSTGNVLDASHKTKMMKAVDNCLKQKSWLVFMSHTNNSALYNGYKSAYTYSEQDENYPSEWSIPLKRDEILTMDENNYWATPPARLGISRWSEWRPASGTQLAAFYDVIEYAISKGVKIVLPSEGWKSHGNRVQLGVDMNGTSAANPNLVDEYTDEEESFFTVGADGSIRCYSK